MTIEWFGSNVNNRWRKSVKKSSYIYVSVMLYFNPLTPTVAICIQQ